MSQTPGVNYAESEIISTGNPWVDLIGLLAFLAVVAFIAWLWFRD
ncbi:hypothetical protein [Nocardia sp. CA-290969]